MILPGGLSRKRRVGYGGRMHSTREILPPGDILVSGATGLVGTALVARLARAGHRVLRLARAGHRGSGHDPVSSASVTWDPEAGRLDPAALEGLGAVVHLAGESIAAGRWTAGRRRRIRSSRVLGTRLLSDTLAALDRPPATLVCASAVGFYGARGAEWLTEDSPAGDGFLPDVCREWEAASEGAARAGIRLVQLRIGPVVSRTGGLLGRLAPLFRLGLGGRVGGGRQYLSWIALEDLVEVALRALRDGALRGPVNAVSPSPVTNAEFTRALGRVLRRPTPLPVPAAALRLVLGEMADALLLTGARVRPARLEAAGFAWRHPELEPALRHALGARR
jgi:uncharacterized protein